MTRYYSSTAQPTTLSAAATDVATSIQVTATTGFPATEFILALDYGTAQQELVKVTAVAGTTLTVVRGFDSTTAQAHSLGAAVRHVHTADDFRLSRTHEAASSGVHGATGALVGTSDAQALTNKDLSSGTNTFPASLATSANLNAHTSATAAHGTTGALVGTSDAQTLTNKTIALGSNTVSGTTAQFNAANTDGDFATLVGAETLTNKTITSATFLAGTLTQLPLVKCTSATRPAHVKGQVIYETDTDLMYVSNGTAWRFLLAEVTDWTAVTFTNSWANFGAPYQTVQYKKVGHRVFLRGTASGGTVGSGTPVFTLPAGFRPPANLVFSIAASGAYGQVEVGTTGTVAVTSAGSNLSANLNGISFEVA